MHFLVKTCNIVAVKNKQSQKKKQFKNADFADLKHYQCKMCNKA